MKKFQIGAGYRLVCEVEIGHYEEHLCTVTNRTATTIYFNNKPYRYSVAVDAKSGSEYVRFGNSEDAPEIYARDEIYSAEETATAVNQKPINAVIASTENKPIKFELQKFAATTSKKFELDACYKAYSNTTEEISRCTYNVQITNRTAQYVKAHTYKGIERYHVKTDADGVEYINISRQDGHRALICRADSKVETPPIPEEIVKAIKAVFGLDSEEFTADTAEVIAEDDGSNDDDFDEDEIAVIYKVDEEEEEDEDELEDPPEVEENLTEEIMPTIKKAEYAGTLDFETSEPSYHVLALARHNVLTFNGKRISQEKAAAEIVYAFNSSKSNPAKNYKNRHAILVLDNKAFLYARPLKGIDSYGDRKNIRFVDFGRDEIPYINAKVQAIIDSYKKQAQKAEVEKAAEIAYKASPQYQLDEINRQMQYYKDDIDLRKNKICNYNHLIIGALMQIANYENIINEYGLQIEEINAKIASAQKAQKFFADVVATENAFKAINSVAVDIMDDGSNDDTDEEERIYTVDICADDDVDDELVDPPQSFCELILDALNIQNNAVCVMTPFTFNLQFFSGNDHNANNLATLDTSVTLAATPPRDIVAELDTVVNNRKAFQKAIRANRQRIEHFENEIFKAELMIKQARRMIEHHKKNIGNLQEAIVSCEDVITRKLPIEILTETADKIAAEFSKIPYKDCTEELMKIVAVDGTPHSLPCNFGALQMTTLHGKVVVMLGNKVLGSYFTSAELETAMQGLMQAIQQGANEYIFPE